MSKHPIIDSHIHLYPKTHVKTLAWGRGLPDGHILNQQLSIDEYRAAIADSSDFLKGFIFVETDRVTGPSPSEWNHTLDETSYIARIINGTPTEGEGHSPGDGDLVLGIIPWAPITEGPDAVSQCLNLTRQRCNSPTIFSKVRGVRYLFQDKPQQTMLQPACIASLKYLGTQSLVFDLGVDARSFGLHQLRETCELFTRLYDSVPPGSEVKIIINHLCKPNLRISAPDAMNGNPDFVDWKSCIETMSKNPHAYMKLSGGWSELPPQPANEPESLDVLTYQIRPWTDVVFQAFGPRRTMFGSDWPVCIAGGPGMELSWKHWKDLVERLMVDKGFSEEEKGWVWAGAAREAYGID